MASSRNFLTQQQADMVVNAIKAAELDTSGEVRVHIEKVCKGDPLQRAVALFHSLGMYRTKARNGVLIYLAYESHKVAIVGDKGINDVVPADFWNGVYGIMKEYFRRNEYAEGLSEAIRMAGRSLKEFFPYQSDDINEQSDEISFG